MRKPAYDHMLTAIFPDKAAHAHVQTDQGIVLFLKCLWTGNFLDEHACALKYTAQIIH